MNSKLPVTSVPEPIAYAKAHPRQLNDASGGIGSTSAGKPRPILDRRAAARRRGARPS